MQYSKLSFILLFVLLGSASLFAQTGVVSGTVIDEASADPLIGAYIFVNGTDKAVATDFDGKYKLDLPAGVYSLKMTYIGYPDKVIEDVTVKEGEITYLDISLSEGTEQMEEIVVKAKIKLFRR